MPKADCTCYIEFYKNLNHDIFLSSQGFLDTKIIGCSGDRLCKVPHDLSLSESNFYKIEVYENCMKGT